MGGPEKWQKWGRAKWVLSRFFREEKVLFEILGKLKERSTFKFCFGRFSFVNSAIFIHSPYQTGSQPMSGRLYMLYIVMLFKYMYIINTIFHSCYVSTAIFVLGSQDFA